MLKRGRGLLWGVLLLVCAATTAHAAPAFPVKYSPDGRYLVDQNGVPFPIMGRTAWFVTSLTVTDYRLFVDDTASRGYSAIELHVINHDPRGNNPPYNGNGDRPFLNRLNGTTWNGSLSYGSINSEAPDFTTPNEAYWSFVDGLLAYAESKGLLVFMFPAYVGYQGGDQGWMQEIVANGVTKMQAYGAWLAARYRNQKNLVWMMGGDMGTAPNTFNASQTTVESALLTGLKSVPGQQSVLFSAEWTSESIGTDQTTFGTSMTLNGAYSWSGDVNTHGRRAYAHSPTEPAFVLEEPYDEEGPDGNNFNGSATQPVRRFQWWGWLSTTAGYISGNGYVWPFRATWRNHLDTQGSRDMARLNGFIGSIAWYDLVPSGLGGMRTLVTAGGSSVSASSYVAAAAGRDGTILVAYVPPAHIGAITVDMGAMSGPARGRWFDPTNAAYTNIGTGLANIGSRSFTPPGNNSVGQRDWVLVLDTASGSPPDTTPPTAPSSLTASASGNQTILNWTAATDNVGVTDYRIERCQSAGCGNFAEVARTTGSQTYLDTGLAPTTTYSYRVRATDSAGLFGPYSNIATATTGSVPAPAGLVAAYGFNEGTGGTVSDASSSGIAGTINAANWTTAGKYGGALSFNGSTSYVDLGNPAALQLTGSMTVEAWVKAPANPADDGQIVAKSDGSGWQLKTSPDTGPHTFGAAVSAGAGSSTQRYSTTVRSLSTWYHVAAVYDAAARTLSIYVNGALDNGTLGGTIPASQIDRNVSVNIGRRTGGFYFNGVIDEVRIYNRALTPTQIQTDMNTPIGTPQSDTTPPTVSMTSPAGGVTVAGSTSVSASASDTVGVAGVQFLLDGANLGAEVTGAGPTYSYTWNTMTAANGPHTLSARARDAANNTTTSANVTVTVSNADTTLPIVSVTSPVAGANLNGSVGIVASASDNVAMGGVQFLLDGASMGAEVTGAGPTYTYTWNTATAANGSHTLSARARDAANNTAMATTVNVTVGNTAPSSLLAAYSFNAGSGTTAADSSGNGITGTLSGATWTTAGKYANALSFNGISSYVDLGNAPALTGTGSMTWAAWINATGTPEDDGQIIAKSDSASGWQLKTSPDTGPHTFGVKVTYSTGSAQRYSKTIRVLNTWYHVAGVYNAATRALDIYVNGVLDNGVLWGTIPGSQTLPSINVNIGRREGGFYFKGTIDDVRVYNRALSQSEIQAIMGTPLP